MRPDFLLRFNRAIGTVCALMFSLGCGRNEDEPSAAPVARVIGEMGTAPGQFFYPRSAAVNEEGELCVVDRSGRIQWFRADGTLLCAFFLPEYKRGQPTGINFSRCGDLLVADSHYGRFLVYRRPKGSEPPPVAASWGQEGEGDGQFTLIRDVVEDSRGDLYAGDYNGPQDRIQKFDAKGKFLLSWGRRGQGAGEFQRPQGLAIERRADGSEFLLVADSCNHRVQRFELDGRFIGSFGRLGSEPGAMKYPYGVAVAPADSLPGSLAGSLAGSRGSPAVYVVEWGNNRVQRFDLDGRPTGRWGRPGRGAGEFATPWDIAVGRDGRVFVVDFGNHRVQVLDLAQAVGG